MEMGWHSRSSRRRHGRGRQNDCSALFAHRRGYFRWFPRPDRSLAATGRNRWRTADHARRLQQRFNRKTVNVKLLAEFPAHLRAYDLLVDGEEDLRERPFTERRRRLERFIARLDEPRVDLSPLMTFATWDDLAVARKDPTAAGAGADAEAVEGIMLKRRDAPYLPGRPKGPWWKWKRDPFIVDAVLMYAQRGHGKRSSYYSDYTFGVWTKGEDGDVLVPV